MITFLNKIAKLPSIQNVLLLSHHGEALFCENNPPSLKIDPQTVTFMHAAIADLKTPKTATLYFKNGFIYLHSTSIGYVIITMKDNRNLEALEDACRKVEKQLEQENVGKKVLLNMLDKAEDRLKPQFIRTLVYFADKEVAKVLMKIIANLESLAANTRNEVLLAACQTIGYCSYFEATACLNAILSDHSAGKHPLNEYIVEAAELAVRQLEHIQPEKSEEPKPQQPKTQKVSTASNTAKSRNIPAAPKVAPVPQELETLPEKDQIVALAAEDRKTEAVKLIVGLINTATQNQQFDKAEALQEWLLQIEPMALTESIRATELIEESKKALIDENFYFVWKNIVDILSAEEFIALYHAMKRKSYASGEHLVQQGQIHSELFFVNTGRVQLYTHIDGREIPLQIVSEGGLLGHGTFFELSVWTSAAKSQGAEVFSLSYESLQKLEKKYPGIESKLSDYCSHIETSTTLLKKMKRSRRQLERKKISGKISFILLGADGKKTEAEGRGNILDISQGGVCFIVHSSQRKNTHYLFGKKIQLSIKKSNTNPAVERNGKILAVRDHDIIGNAYSVHVEFDTLLTGSELREIVAFNR
ncbi:cyclic nucleotide-binding domain-containing protein [Desulforhopalus sp. IMCC35007]|uniref:cyclic nucleotide-binding domain-containing protein n=1 Tax=Desulforhopalus sp. IMCC35007 TaxID=2569543 RepID=UPI0010ADB98A|nr:cyclic nucleotide-binding domain-containing protein [Desulforhopalus sp. IMCC35007]TKB06019.1 cyclic nucleotide-binding domain-containing protein [Desulforhopalus sp. IMCC35007]